MALGLPVRVHGRETSDHEWEEMSRLVDVTPFGARLRLKRPTEIGRLLHLTMAMPRQLRCFDHIEDQYRIWSLVRNVKLLDPKSQRGAVVEIGVAFVGKRPPQSFLADPSNRYQIAKSSSEALLWSIKEESDDSVEQLPAEKRADTRHNIPIEVLIEPFVEGGAFEQSESTVTENISRRGAVVFTTLELARGRFVRITSQRHDVQVLAVVRAFRWGPDGIGRLHLEFVGSEWPL